MIKRNILECMTLVGKAPSHYEGAKTYVSTGAVDCDHIDYKQTEQVTYDNRPSRANLSVTSGDILFAKMCGTKKTLRINDVMAKYLFSTGFCAVRANESVMIADLLYHLLSSEQFLTQKDQNSSGATQKAITNTGLKKITIQVPNLEEQRVLAAKLDCIEQMMAKRRIQLEYFDQLVKSRFIEMFGDIFRNDRGWTIQPLGELCTIVRGGSPRPIEKFLGGDVPWIKIGDATDGESIYLHSTKEHIIREGVSKSRMVKAGSLIFANCGVSLGFARIITVDGCIHDGWLAMEDIDARLDKVFLLQALNQMTEHFRKIAPAGTQPNLNTAIMKAYKQIIPPMKLQKDFISFVERTDKSKYRQEKCIRFFQCLEKNIRQEWL